MGKEIEKVAQARQLIITDIFEINNRISADKTYDFDVAIDFSYPDNLLENISILSHLKKNIVIGTTGWYTYMEDVCKIISDAENGCIFGSNYSVGMQMFLKITDYASKLMNNTSDYDIFVHEIHHKRKKDAPSGTALSIADIIIKNIKQKNEIQSGELEGSIVPDKLHVSSSRGGEVAGTHTVYMDSLADTIELTHRAKNRSGFAMGAVTAAQWIHEKKGMFQFKDMLNDIWKD
jgi:4-hydroxy-tetrahydrodipicolinate reductase